jgi:cell division protein FtsI (penicillin-binding protein 3)
LKSVRAGQDVVLSLDRRVQYFAYRALLKAVKQHRAKSATAVVMDVKSGEILAMVNYPTYNPNKPGDRVSARFRNRAVTDVFEPGSTAKIFTVAAALESGKFNTESLIDTTPGIYKVAGHTVRDSRNYGRINLQTLIKKSSNVGVSKLSLAIPPQYLWQTLTRFGFGQTHESGFPGESTGVLPHYFEWKTINRVTLSFGYGLSVTTLQLVAAYAAIANDGVLPEVTLLRREVPAKGLRVVSSGTARQLLRMLESVTNKGGTGTRAAVHGYRSGGKTGTTRKLDSTGYSDKNYLASFSGIVPMSAPRLAIVVTVDNPRGKVYYGGQVAAPVFSEIAAGSLRVLGIPPDAPRPPAGKGRERLAGLNPPNSGAVQ